MSGLSLELNPTESDVFKSPQGQPVGDYRNTTRLAHGVGRVVGALGSEAGFAGSMLN